MFKKPLFWTNIASLTFVGLIVAGLAFGWNNPTAAPSGGSGAIRADASGNVRIGGIGIPGAKLHVSGDFLVDAGGGITLGGTKRTSWPINTNANIECGASAAPSAMCQSAGNGIVYGVYSYWTGQGTNPVVLSSSIAAPGVIPMSSIKCGASAAPSAMCQILATDRIYGVYTYWTGQGTNPIMLVSSVAAPGVTPMSSIKCGASGAPSAMCQILATDKIYGVYTYWTGQGTNPVMLISSIAAPGVVAPQ